MAWLIVCNSSGVAQGRVRLGALSKLYVDTSGSPTNFFVAADGDNGLFGLRLSANLPSFTTAVAKIDDLILNGS